MAIYDFSTKPACELETPVFTERALPRTKKHSIFSALASRIFFFLLLAADLVWMSYTIISSAIFLSIIVCTGGRSVKIRQWQSKKWISLRRSLVCAVALVVALFSPSFGVMVACTYFLMYDKSGIEEVVPTALQSEFKELMPKNST